MKALVTGASGFIGLYIAEQLAARGDVVRAFCRTERPEFEQAGIEFFPGCLQQEESLQQAVQGCDVVFHVAGSTGLWGSWKHFYEVNTLGTQHVLEACKKHQIPKLIYTSSPSVIFDGSSHENGNEQLPYPQKYLCHYSHTKALGEQEVLQANQPGQLLTAAIRPHLVWGPRDENLIPRVCQLAQSGRLRRVGNGKNLISVSYVENVAAAHLQLADALATDSPTAGQTYFINDPEPVLLWEWLNSLLKSAAIPPINKSISLPACQLSGWLLETLYSIFPLKGEPAMTRFLAAQLGQSHYYSIEKAQRDFNYQPILSVEEGLKKLKPELLKWSGNKS